MHVSLIALLHKVNRHSTQMLLSILFLHLWKKKKKRTSKKNCEFACLSQCKLSVSFFIIQLIKLKKEKQKLVRVTTHVKYRVILLGICFYFKEYTYMSSSLRCKHANNFQLKSIQTKFYIQPYFAIIRHVIL